MLNQIKITLLGRFKQKTLCSLHSNIKCFLSQQSSKTLPSVRLLIKLLKIIDMNAQNLRFCHGLCVVIARNLVYKALKRNYKLVSGVKKYIFLITCLFVNHK